LIDSLAFLESITSGHYPARATLIRVITICVALAARLGSPSSALAAIDPADTSAAKAMIFKINSVK
jgi:hypothetical protein